jgi:hypothetical protein
LEEHDMTDHNQSSADIHDLAFEKAVEAYWLAPNNTVESIRAAICAYLSGAPAQAAVVPAADERERCIAICEGWMDRFEGMEIQYTSPREYACDAINDIMDLIRDGIDPRSQAKEPEASGQKGSPTVRRVRVGEASADLPATSEFMDVTAGETAPHFQLSAGSAKAKKLAEKYERILDRAKTMRRTSMEMRVFEDDMETIIAALRVLNEPQPPSTYTEICMNEKCPRGCGVPVEVVRSTVTRPQQS